MRHNGPRPHNGIFAHGHTRHDNSPRTNPGEFLNVDGPADADVALVGVVIHREHRHLRRDLNTLLNRNACGTAAHE